MISSNEQDPIGTPSETHLTPASVLRWMLGPLDGRSTQVTAYISQLASIYDDDSLFDELAAALANSPDAQSDALLSGLVRGANAPKALITLFARTLGLRDLPHPANVLCRDRDFVAVAAYDVGLATPHLRIDCRECPARPKPGSVAALISRERPLTDWLVGKVEEVSDGDFVFVKPLLMSHHQALISEAELIWALLLAPPVPFAPGISPAARFVLWPVLTIFARADITALNRELTSPNLEM